MTVYTGGLRIMNNGLKEELDALDKEYAPIFDEASKKTRSSAATH